MALHIQIGATRKTVVRAGDIIPEITARVKFVALHIQIGATRKTVVQAGAIILEMTAHVKRGILDKSVPSANQCYMQNV